MKVRKLEFIKTWNEGLTLQDALFPTEVILFPALTAPEGYIYLYMYNKYNTSGKIRDICLTAITYDRSQIWKIDGQDEYSLYNDNFDQDAHQYSITTHVLPAYYFEVGIGYRRQLYVMVIYTNMSTWKVYHDLFIFTFENSGAFTYIKKKTYSYDTVSSCIQDTTYNRNVLLTYQSHHGCNNWPCLEKPFIFIFEIKYDTSETFVPIKITYYNDYDSFTETSISGLSINISTEAIMKGFFYMYNTEEPTYYFMKIREGNYPIKYKINLRTDSSVTEIGEDTTIICSTESNKYILRGQYFEYDNGNAKLFFENFKSRFKPKYSDEYITLSSTKGGIISHNLLFFPYQEGVVYIQFAPFPIGFSLDKDVYMFYSKQHNIFTYYPIKGYYHKYNLDEYNKISFFSNTIFGYYSSGLTIDEYSDSLKTYTPERATIQKKVFSADILYLEDENTLPRSIELYDDTDTLLFSGFSKEGYEKQSTKYKNEYISIIDQDLKVKLNVSFSEKTVSQMIQEVLSKYCSFLYAGTIESTSNTYTYTEKRTIGEFLKWCAYIETKIINIDPDGTVDFTSGTYESGTTPFEVTIVDPNKKFKYKEYYPTRFYVIGGITESGRIMTTRINDPNGEPYILYCTNITSQTELEAILEKIIEMKQQKHLRLDFTNYGTSTLYKIGDVIKITDETEEELDGKNMLVMAIDQDLITPDMTSYVLSNVINYGSSQENQQQERIQIIEQDIEDVEQDISTIKEKQAVISAFSAYSNTRKTLYNGSNTKYIYDNVSYDLANEYNATTGRFTAKKKGIYHFDASLLTDSVSWPANRVFCILLYKNASLYLTGNRIVTFAAITGYLHSILSIDLELDVNDYVEIYYYQDSGANIYSYDGRSYCQFTGHLITPTEE